MRKLLLTVLPLLLLTGCVTPPATVGLKPDVSPKLHTSNGVIVVTQNEITAEIDPSEIAVATGGGLIPALIDAFIESARAKTAEELIEPIRDSLLDYDFHTQLFDSLQPELTATDWLGVTRVERSTDPSDNLHEQLLPDGSEDALVIVYASYMLSPDFTWLKTKAVLEVHPRAEGLAEAVESTRENNAGPPLVYKDTVTYTEVTPESAASKAAAAEIWADKDGEAIRQALTRSVKQLVAELVAGLRAPEDLP